MMMICGLVITVKGTEPGGRLLNSGWWPQGGDLGEKEEDQWHQKEKSELYRNDRAGGPGSCGQGGGYSYVKISKGVVVTMFQKCDEGRGPGELVKKP